MTSYIETQLKFLLDREAIRDVIMRYCHGADRCDESMLQSVYWPDATDDHGVFSGSASNYIPFLLKTAAQMDQMQHLVGNMLIRNSDNTASCESYFFGYHRVRNERGVPQDMIASGRYLDELEQRDGEWRILRRKVVFDWFRNLEGSADWTQGLGGVPVTMGARVPEDASVKHFSQRALNLPAFKA
jgi:SnoaL-like domain